MAKHYSDDEKNKILAALVLNGGNIAHTAGQFGVSRPTLRKWAKRIHQAVAPAPAAEEPDGPELNYRQRVFVNMYFIEHYNGTKAAAAAGYGGDNATLAAIASENLRKPHIRAAIEARMDEETLTAKQVLHAISQAAVSTIADFYSLDASGQPKLDLKKAETAGKLHLISKMTFYNTTGYVKSIELDNRTDARRDMGRYYKLFTDRIEVFDWRKEVEEEGHDAGQLYQQLVNALAESFAAGAGSDHDAGGAAG